MVELDGTAGYAAAFLEEAFGGLIREEGFNFEDIQRALELVSIEEPQLVDEIKRHILGATPKLLIYNPPPQ